MFGINKTKKVIRLFGVGGNLKTSILSHKAFKSYVHIPEFNREAGRLSARFNENLTTTNNLVAKYLLIKSLLHTKETKFISDRSLIDYGIMNELIKEHLPDYFGAVNDLLTVEKAFEMDDDLYKDVEKIDVLLITKDEEFISKIIDNSHDERAYFFDNSRTYFNCQEIYYSYITAYLPEVTVIELKDISNPKLVIEDIVDKIKSL